MLWLLLLFTVLPMVELALLIQIGKVMGVWATIAVVLLTGMLGWWLARREGLRTWVRIQSELSQGRLPGNHLVDALLILGAGVLLVTPGVLTDTVGFLLLIPPVRALARNALKKRFQARIVMVNMTHNMSGFRRSPDDFVDVEAYEADDAPTSAGRSDDVPPHLENRKE
jgi:UPF0716 family protein affecting phage T7 exclusion